MEILDGHFNQLGNDFGRGAFQFDGSATQNPASRTGPGNPMADFPAAYAVQPFGTRGNAGRNTVNGPGIVGWDLSAQKNFRVAAKKSLQFRFEAFNFPNHPNWGDPGNLVTVNGFGTITTTRTDRRDLHWR